MIREQLVPKIHSLAGQRLRRPTYPPPPPPVRPGPLTPPAARTGRLAALTIAASTGGPDALSKVITRLPATLPVPVLIVQHMPPVFTKMFAERLDRSSAVTVVEAKDGVPVQPGVVYLAPGDYHLTVTGRAGTVLTRLTQGPPENSCRPAADVLFRSVAEVYGSTALAVVLTGMGQDGMRGAERLRETGAEVVAQDQASSVVWGMPGAVVTAGLADTVLPLEEIGAFLTTRLAAVPVARPKVVLS
jgi:two-component system, chemotaxis family, protein-glutamate methylesterase/glutaminase